MSASQIGPNSLHACIKSVQASLEVRDALGGCSPCDGILGGCPCAAVSCPQAVRAEKKSTKSKSTTPHQNDD